MLEAGIYNGSNSFRVFGSTGEEGGRLRRAGKEGGDGRKVIRKGGRRDEQDKKMNTECGGVNVSFNSAMEKMK